MKISQIKRFKYRFYHLKHYWKFLFVHKPLCKKFKKETLFLFNKMYFCRSCFFLYCGFLLSFSLSLFFLDEKYLNENVMPLVVMTLITILASIPMFYKNYSRSIRDMLRFLTGVILGFAVVIAVKINFLAGLFFLFVLFLFKKIYNKLRKNVDLCKDCPQLTPGKTCDGYIMQKNALLEAEEDYSKTLQVAWKEQF